MNETIYRGYSGYITIEQERDPHNSDTSLRCVTIPSGWLRARSISTPSAVWRLLLRWVSRLTAVIPTTRPCLRKRRSARTASSPFPSPPRTGCTAPCARRRLSPGCMLFAKSRFAVAMQGADNGEYGDFWYPSVEAGAQGVKWIEKCVESADNGPCWVKY